LPGPLEAGPEADDELELEDELDELLELEELLDFELPHAATVSISASASRAVFHGRNDVLMSSPGG
jgi:hypothetical protein